MRHNQTGFVWHERYMWHDTGKFAGSLPPGFPLQPLSHHEDPETKRRIKNLLDASGYIENLKLLQPREATDDELLRFHTEGYLTRIRELSADERVYSFEAGSHAVMGRGSFDIAKLAAGGVIVAADAVLKGEVQNAYALVRPPGHHALADQGMGFCVFGNVAIAAHHLLEARGIQRIAVVDWDVHHGNGTQSAFYNDQRVLTISIHQDRCYPWDTGLSEERGDGAGFGFNINIPLPPGSSVGAYDAAFDRVVIPALESYQPEFIFVSCGFDAGAFDVLARQMMTTKGFQSIARKVKTAADTICHGRLVLCHEGGYHAPTVPFFALAVLEEMTGISSGIADPHEFIFDALTPQELQPHQDAAIAKAEELVKFLSGEK